LSPKIIQPYPKISFSLIGLPYLAPSYNGKGIRPLPHADSKIDLDNDHPYNTMYLKPLSTMDEQDEEQVNDDFALTLRDPDQEPPNLMEGVIFEYVKVYICCCPWIHFFAPRELSLFKLPCIFQILIFIFSYHIENISGHF